MFTTERTNTAEKKSQVFLFIHILLFVSQKRGSSVLLHCVPQLTCKSVNFLIGQLLKVWTHVFPLLRAKQIGIQSATKTLKVYRITTVPIKMNVLNNVSASELSIDMAL